MNDKEARQYAMLRRVCTFGETYCGDFPPTSEPAKHFVELAAILTQLDAAKVAQHGGTLTEKEALIDETRQSVQNVVRTARAIAQEEPGFADSFRPPATPSQTSLLTAVDAMLERLQAKRTDSEETKAAKEALVARFVGYLLPEDFVTGLAAKRDAVDKAQDKQEITAATSVAGTASISLLMREGSAHVKHLDAAVHNRFSAQPEVLRAWESASHTERAPRREKKKAEAATSAPTAPAVTV